MIPHYLTLKNFMSHKDSKLDFDQFEAALLVGSHNGDTDISNGVGKTAIFDAIVWCLFDKSRFRKKNRVIKRGEGLCSVEFIFDMDNEKYKILRKLNAKGVTDVSFFLQQNSEWKDLTCDTSRVTNKKIIEVIKLNYETFINSIYFKQHDLLRFAHARAADRKEILKDLLQIGIWDKYQERAKSIAKELKNKKNLIEERIKNLGDIKKELQNLNTTISIVEFDITETDKEIEVVEVKLRKARENLGKVKASNDTIDVFEIEKQIEEINNKSEEIIIRKESIKEEALSTKEKIKRMTDNNTSLIKKINEHAKKIIIINKHKGLDKARAILKSDTEEFLSIVDKKEIKDLEKNLTLYKQKLKQTKALEPGSVCPTCLRKIENIDDVLRERNSIILETGIKINELSKKLSELKNIDNIYKKALNEADNSLLFIEKAEMNISQNIELISSLTKMTEKLHDEFSTLSKNYKILFTKKEKLALNLKQNNHYDLKNAKKKAEAFQKNVKILREKRIKLGSEFGNLQGQIENVQRKRSELDVLLSQKIKINEDLDVHRRLVKAFGKNGVQAIIMENITEDLQNYANNVMKQISNDPMTIEFLTQRQTVNGSWSETFDIKVYTRDGQVDFDDLSGGEQVRISIALRLALSRILMRRLGSNVRFLLLDEVDQALDKKGLQALSETIKLLSKEFKVLVITHNDNMKDNFDNVITIFKESYGSVLVQ